MKNNNGETKMLTVNGRDIVGLRMRCEYQGSKDPAPLTLEGTVKAQRKIEGKGTLVTVQTTQGYRSFYFEKSKDCVFFVRREKMRNTDDGYDAWKDGMIEKYGIGWRKR